MLTAQHARMCPCPMRLSRNSVRPQRPEVIKMGVIEADRGIQEKSGHQRRRLRMALSNRASRSSDLFNVCGAALSEFRVVGGIPGPCGKLQGFALFVAPHIAPQHIDDVSCAWLVFGTGQPNEFWASSFGILTTLGIGSCSWYHDGFPVSVPQPNLSAIGLVGTMT